MFFFIFSVLLLCLLLVVKKKCKLSKIKIDIISIFIITLIFELTIFNFGYYRLKFSNYKEIKYNISDCELNGFELVDENTYIVKDDNAYIEIDNIDSEVGTIYLDGALELNNVENTDTKERRSLVNSMEYRILYTDDTSESYRTFNTKFFVNSIEKSKYSNVFLSGKSKKIAIQFVNFQGRINLNSITVNKNIPFTFNIPRYVCIVMLLIMIYSLKKFNIWNLTYEQNSDKVTNIILLTIMSFSIVCLVISIGTIVIENDFYSNEYAQSLINKSFNLQEKPSQELLNLENPYDTTMRSRNICKWDTVLFNGEYYIYFGILPELILFVPYMFIKHTYLPSGVGVIFFSTFAILGLGLLLFEILRKWFGKLPVKLWFFSEIIILSGCIIFNLIGSPRFYEVLVSSGLCFSVYGILFAFRFFAYEKIKYRYLFISCLLLALAIACRPTTMFVSLIVLIPIIKTFIDNCKSKENIIKTILSVGIPYITIGIALMIVNYIRFKNPFEFGAKFQLTVNDMSRLKYRLLTIPAGLFLALFKIPRFITVFPFIEQDPSTISFFGYFYSEDNIGGLFILVPICFSLFLLPKIKGKINDGKLKYLLYSFIIVGVFICCFSIYQAGVLQRYLADYAWLLIIASIIIILTFYQDFKSEEMKCFFRKCIGYTCLYVFFINLISGAIVGEKNYMRVNNPDIFYNLRYSICFWE